MAHLVKVLKIFFFVCISIFAFHLISQRNYTHEVWSKVELDLTQLDSEGLYGLSDGKVALSYEFCIPNNDESKAQVKAIDGTVQFMPGSTGRIGADKEQCLCIGSTYQEKYRDVLYELASLPYIERIIVCHFE